MLWLTVPALILAAIFIWLAVRLRLPTELRRWWHWRKYESRSTAGSAMRGVLGTFQEIVQPEVRYVNEEKRQRRAESDDRDPSER